MANAMSISDKILHATENTTDLPARLNAIFRLLQKEYGLRVNFCRIFGKRWSYVAGDRTLAFVPVSRQLSPQYGIFYEQNNNIDDRLMEEILQTIKHILMETENE